MATPTCYSPSPLIPSHTRRRCPRLEATPYLIYGTTTLREAAGGEASGIPGQREPRQIGVRLGSR